MENNYQIAKDMVKCLLGIEFEVIENSNDAFIAYLQRTMSGILSESPSALERIATYRLFQPNCIYELRTLIGMQYHVFLNQAANQLFLLGPSLSEPFSVTNAKQKLHQLTLSRSAREKILTECSTLPVISVNTLYRLCNVFLHHFDQNTGPVLYHTIDLSLEYAFTPATSFQNEIPHMRQIENRYEISSILTDAVKQGNFSLAIGLLNRYEPSWGNEARNANPLRNFQNYCIILNTQLRHALESSGIHPYQLDRLSNAIGIEIETLHSLTQAQDFIFSTIQRYCNLVRDNAYPNLKPLVHLAVTYIKDHLNEDLTVKETAKILGVNANYLSTQFHESMGLTFIDFVHRERTQQAAALLLHTTLQIQQISSEVGYNNTSYFTKQFLRFQGMNPGRYRKEGSL